MYSGSSTSILRDMFLSYYIHSHIQDLCHLYQNLGLRSLVTHTREHRIKRIYILPLLVALIEYQPTSDLLIRTFYTSCRRPYTFRDDL